MRTKQFVYECKENDNFMRVQVTEKGLDEIVVYDTLRKSGVVIGSKDLSKLIAQANREAVAFRAECRKKEKKKFGF